MHVHAAGHPSQRPLDALRPAPQAPPAPAPQTTTPPQGDTVDLTQPQTNQEMPGVLRNLFDGHYKGVADVRLRIVHAEKIAQLTAPPATAPTDTAAPPTVDDVRTLVNDQLAALPDVGALTEEQSAAVETAAGEFTAALDAVDPEAGDPTDALTAAKDNLLAALQTTLVGDAAEPNGYEEFVAGLGTALGELIAGFAATPEQSEEPAEPALTLPPLSQPAGQGKAYAKFLAQYEQLYGLTMPAEAPPAEEPTAEPLDTIA